MITDAVAGAGLLAGILSIILNCRQQSGQRVVSDSLRAEMVRRHEECLLQIGKLAEDVAAAERVAQSSAELMGDGRLAMPARTRALRMLRAGKSADTIAKELGLGRREVELLAKMASLLAASK